jgi:hypothetical protein
MVSLIKFAFTAGKVNNNPYGASSLQLVFRVFQEIAQADFTIDVKKA